jgi:hypothetical protein
LDSKGPKVDVICTSDTVSALGFTISCQKFIAHLVDSYVQSGEIAQRLSESKDRLQGGPPELAHLITFEAKDEPQLVWTSGDVKASAVRSTHIAGHASYRVDTPAGSVVIGALKAGGLPEQRLWELTSQPYGFHPSDCGVDVRLWPKADMGSCTAHVRFQV